MRFAPAIFHLRSAVSFPVGTVGKANPCAGFGRPYGRRAGRNRTGREAEPIIARGIRGSLRRGLVGSRSRPLRRNRGRLSRIG